MLLCELVHLPVTLACHSGLIVSRLRDISDQRLHEYWIASRTRILRWSQRLRVVTEQIHGTKQEERTAIWMESTALLREILLCELTAHLWSALLAGVDRRRGTDDYSAIARGIWQGHMEVRHRVLNLLLLAKQESFPHVDRLDGDRRRFERWCDVLLLQLPSDCPIDLHQSALAAETDLHGRLTSAVSGAVLAAGMLAASPSLSHEPAPLGRLHRRVSNAILGCLGSVLFEGGCLPLGALHAGLLGHESDRRSGIEAWLPPPSPAIRPIFGRPGSPGRF